MHLWLRAAVMASWPSFCWLAGWLADPDPLQKWRKASRHTYQTVDSVRASDAHAPTSIACLLASFAHDSMHGGVAVRLGFDVTQKGPWSPPSPSAFFSSSRAYWAAESKPCVSVSRLP